MVSTSDYWPESWEIGVLLEESHWLFSTESESEESERFHFCYIGSADSLKNICLFIYLKNTRGHFYISYFPEQVGAEKAALRSNSLRSNERKVFTT